MPYPSTADELQEAFRLIKAGRNAEASDILLPLVARNQNDANGWYLLGFAVPDRAQKIDCFKRVLRIDPANTAARKQLDQLGVFQRDIPDVGTYDVQHSFGASKSSSFETKRETASKSNGFFTIRNIILAVIGGIVLLVMIGIFVVYYSNGMTTSNEVNALFQQGKCTEVMTYQSFGNSFPRGIFSSAFGVYHQLEECKSRLALADAVKAQDWPGSYTIIDSYLAAYPGGAFAGEMSEQAGTVLLAWSKDLMVAKDYATAIQKLEMIQSTFSASSVAPAALSAMYDDYLLWGKFSFDQKDYPNAERVLKIVGWDSQASQSQVKQADLGLATVYLQWGHAQIASGEFEKGLLSYDNAKALNPTLADYDRLKAQAPLIKADVLLDASDFDGALKYVDDLLATTLSDTTRSDALAEQSKIINAYSASYAPQARAQMRAVTANVCKRQELPIVPIFGKDADFARFTVLAPSNLQLPADWTARRPAELHYILCIDPSHTIVEECGAKFNHANRYRYFWDLRLYDATTGVAFQATKLQGSKPGDCQQASSNDLYGKPPTIQQAVDWLTPLGLLK